MINIEYLQKQKKALGLTLDDIAEKSGISRRTVARVFSGNPKYPDPTYNTITAIEKALGLNDSSKDWTAEERAAGVVDSVKVSVTAQEYNLLDMFREIGRTKGADKQQIIIELLEILLKF